MFAVCLDFFIKANFTLLRYLEHPGLNLVQALVIALSRPPFVGDIWPCTNSLIFYRQGSWHISDHSINFTARFVVDKNMEWNNLKRRFYVFLCKPATMTARDR